MRTLFLFLIGYAISSVSYADIGYGISEVGTLSSLKFGSISGYVLNDETPITNQKVILYQYNEYPNGYGLSVGSTYSDEQGRYFFTDLEDSHYSVFQDSYERSEEYPINTPQRAAYIVNGCDISAHNIYLAYEIELISPAYNEYAFSPVTINWPIRSNETKYHIIVKNMEKLTDVYDNTISSNVLHIELDPGAYRVYVESYSDLGYSSGRISGSTGGLKPFKVDIPIISDPPDISTDITWSGEIHLTEDITIEQGARLTIEPGTTIYIAKSDASNQGTNTYEKSVISIDVSGELIANGTPEQPVKFIPEEGNNDANMSFWSGIYLNGSLHSEISNCLISCTYAGIGLYSNSTDNKITKNTFNKTDIGILLTEQVSTPLITNNDFINTNICIFAESSSNSTGFNPDITYNNFYYNEIYSSWAVYLSNDNPNMDLDCRNNYWDTSFDDIPNRFYSVNYGTVLYDPSWNTPSVNNPWTVEIANWDIPHQGSSNLLNSLAKASDSDGALIAKMANTLGPTDNRYFSLGYGGYITFYLGEENAISDSVGNDLIIYESIIYDSTQTHIEDEAANILLANSVDGPWELAARITGSAAIDIDSLSSDNYSYLRVQDASFGDSLHTSPGFDLDAVYVNHRTLATVIEKSNINNTPNKFSLHQNYPNPFNPSTTISYKLNKSENISINLYSIEGKFIKNIFKGRNFAGEHKIKFIADGLSSGIYFYSLKAGVHSTVKKMILIR